MAKKSYTSKDNPVMNFISQASIDEVDGVSADNPSTGAANPPAGYKVNHAVIETKSRRIQLLMQPSLYGEAKDICNELGISLNEFINRAVRKATHDKDILEQIIKELKG